ncbi:MAG: DUF748 domain-containing protein [Bacteroidales bacterium]|nr:DUF748 domain-containing protein [Bacteroidales bacterium]
MKKTVKVAAVAVLAVAGVLAALSLAAGPVAKGYVNRNGERLTGRKVQLGHAGVNLFTGHVNLRGLAVMEEDGATVFASFDTLDLSLRLLALPLRTVHLGHITLCGLRANALQQGDRFNFSSMLEHFQTDGKKESKPSRWRVKLRNLRLAHASLYYSDLLSRKELILPDINLRVPGFTIGGKEQSNGGLTLGFADGGSLEVDARYDATLDRYTMNLRLDDFSLKNIQELVADAAGTERLRGTLQASLLAKGEASHLLASQIGGRATLTGADVHTAHGRLASLDTLDVAINNINLEKSNIDLQSLLVSGLEAYIERRDTASQPPAEPEAATPPAGQKQGFNIGIADLRLRRCALRYTDHTLPDKLSLPITGITLDATNISTRGANNARLAATLPGGGRVRLRWQGMIDHWKQFQDVALDIDGLELKQLNPLVVAYTGRGFDDGVLGLNSRLRIDRSQLSNQNHLDIYRASVGKKRKGVEPRANVPLKTALFVLKDKDERILIDMPVQGDIDAPEFNYMKLVWRTLGNLLAKVATSPVRAVAGALGLGGDDLDFLAVDPGQPALGSQQYHTLSQLAKAAAEEPLLTITLHRQLPPQADSAAVADLESQIASYMAGQGMDTGRLAIVPADSTASANRSGYTITSAMQIKED